MIAAGVIAAGVIAAERGRVTPAGDARTVVGEVWEAFKHTSRQMAQLAKHTTAMPLPKMSAAGKRCSVSACKRAHTARRLPPLAVTHEPSPEYSNVLCDPEQSSL